MSSDLVPWVFILLLMAAGMILAVTHAQSVAECHPTHASQTSSEPA